MRYVPAGPVEGENLHAVVQLGEGWTEAIQPPIGNLTGTSRDASVPDNGEKRRPGPEREKAHRLDLIQVTKAGFVLDEAPNLLIDHINIMGNQVHVPPQFSVLGEKLDKSEIVFPVSRVQKKLGFIDIQPSAAFGDPAPIVLWCKILDLFRELKKRVMRPNFERPAPERGGDEQVQVICLCNCNFSFGIIVEEQTDKLSGDGSTLYTVLVCHNKTGYVVVKDALASDFSKYIVGQKVLVMPYNEMLYTCCNKAYTATGCMPVKSEELIDDDAWRTTVRILPWCAFVLQKWIKVN